MLDINNKLYPSVSYYLIIKLLTLLPEIRFVKNAYKYLLEDPTRADIKYHNITDFLPLEVVTENYLKIKDTSYRDNLIKNAQVAMDKKFLYDDFKELLLLTGNSNIIYTDFQDPILGIGKDKNGENFVGTYLMQLRDSIFPTYNTGKYPMLELNDIDKIYNYNYIRNWFEMKATDMTFTLKLVKNFLDEQYRNQFNKDCKTKNGNDCFNINKDYKLNHRILEIIYKYCKPLNKQYRIRPPTRFENFIKSKLRNPSNNVIKQLWDRILSQFEAISQNTTVFTFFTFRQFTTLNSLKLSLAKCNERCVVSAMNNNIEDLHDLLKSITKIETYNNITTEYAKLLILGSNYKKKKEKVVDDKDDEKYEEVGAQESKAVDIADEDNLDDIDYPDFEDEEEDEEDEEEYGLDDAGVLSNTDVFTESLEEIKNAKLPYNLKNNRIKYFATLK